MIPIHTHESMPKNRLPYTNFPILRLKNKKKKNPLIKPPLSPCTPAGVQKAKRYICEALDFGVQSGYLMPKDTKGRLLRVSSDLLQSPEPATGRSSRAQQPERHRQERKRRRESSEDDFLEERDEEASGGGTGGGGAGVEERKNKGSRSKKRGGKKRGGKSRSRSRSKRRGGGRKRSGRR